MSAGREWMQNGAEVGSIRRRLEDLQAVVTAAPAASEDAHREILRARRADGRGTHPFYWAAFTATGD